MKGMTGALLFAALAALFAPPPAQAQTEAETKALGLAAARADAFLNLTKLVYGMPVGARTAGDAVGADVPLRDRLDAALRGAYLVGKARTDDARVVHVTVEFKTATLPYELRLKLRNVPYFMRADGVASEAAALESELVEIGTVPDEVKDWAAKTIEAEGRAEMPRIADPEQAKTEALRLAMTAAYTDLAAKVLALKLDKDVAIEGFIAQHEEVRVALNATLIGARLVSESVDRLGTTYTVKIELPGRAVLRPLKVGGYRTLHVKTLSADEVEQARKNARKDAIESLKERIGLLPLVGGVPARDMIAKRPKMQDEIDMLCRLAPIDRVEITDEGLVKQYASVPTQALPDEVRGMLVSGTPARIYVVGGGLPVEVKKRDTDETPEDKKPEPAGAGSVEAPKK